MKGLLSSTMCLISLFQEEFWVAGLPRQAIKAALVCGSSKASFKAAQPVRSPAVETEVGTGHWAGRGAKALQGLADGQGSLSRAQPQGKAWLQ